MNNILENMNLYKNSQSTNKSLVNEQKNMNQNYQQLYLILKYIRYYS